jgi:DNA polymerase delta subunit 1
LVITKGLSKKVADGGEEEEGDGKANDKSKNATYKSNSAHVQLAQKMKARDAASAPNVGDRVAYVMVKGMKGSKGYENSEDPIFVLNNNLPIDYTYYIENQIKLPLTRIFEPIFGDVKKAEAALFTGDHVRTIYQPKMNTNKGLGMFA